ncbi:GNAT family N-acetyltransferase [Actinoplanes solisilvae]|uniref:GNAT family N-acetyltransferase n=1 Tax=Actinoplanes solisilvae TaxID=2486853 RepID=UPI000FD8320C|nr:GNAT family N-acetyltransferase [Actinoplanes solisilvae]
MDVRLASGAGDAASVRRLVDLAFMPYIPRVGGKPVPMLADYDAVVAAGHCWVAVDAERVVGMMHLEPADDHLVVETLAVDPEVRGQGVGGRLLALAEEQARSLGVPELRLYTHEAMTENLAYYPRRGFTETHRSAPRVFYTKTVG